MKMRDLKFWHEIEDMMEEQLNDCYEPITICTYNYDQGSALRRLDPIAFDQEVQSLASHDYQEIHLDDMTDEEKEHYGISHSQTMYCHTDEVE